MWHYRYVLTEQVEMWVRNGWEYVGDITALGGWPSSLIRRWINGDDT